MTTKVTKESLAENIGRLESYGDLSLNEEYQLKAYRQHLNMLEAVEDKKVKCVWRYSEAEYSWASSCGSLWQFMDGDPVDNGVKYCHCCGRKVDVHD